MRTNQKPQRGVIHNIINQNKDHVTIIIKSGCNEHIHICCLLSKKISQIKLLEEVKKESSKWIKTKGKQYEKFYWQDGYGIFSVNPSELGKVVEYIDNQREHHKKLTFQQEFLKFLRKYNVVLS